MRGKDEKIEVCAERAGITPAYAGKSIAVADSRTFISGSPPPMRGKGQARSRRRSSSQDHPRLCGEKFGTMMDGLTGTGSPPPMRGKVRHYVQGSVFYEDHPRLCGEKYRG